MTSPFETNQTVSPQIPEHPFQQSNKRKRIVKVLGIILGILALAGVTYGIITSQQGVVVITDIQPNYKITINNQTISSNKETVKVTKRPGTYRLTITRPNYQPFVQDVQVSKQSTITIRPTFTVVDNQTLPTSVASVDHAFVSPDEKFIYFLGDGRKHLYRLTIANQSQSILTERPLDNVLDIAWSLDPDLALITQADGVYLQEIPKYDFKNQTLVKLAGPEIVSPVWDPTTHSTRMAFAYYPGSGEKSLVFAGKRLQNMDRKADISSLPRVKLTWSPDARYLALTGISDKKDENNLWIYTTSDGSLNQVTQGGNITNIMFSSTGSALAYETTTPDGYAVQFINTEDGKPLREQAIPTRLQHSAWKGDSTFLTANIPNKVIQTYDLVKSDEKDIPCMFPNNDPIKGMFYFSSTGNLIYYTEKGIYTSILTF